MSVEDRHVALLKEAYRRWSETKAGSVDHWVGLATDDVRLRSMTGGTTDGAPAMGFHGDFVGRDTLRDYFSQMANVWEMVSYEPLRFVAQGDQVAVLGTCEWKSKKTGKIAESPFAQFFTFRDGHIAEIVEMFDTAAGIAAHAG